MREPHFNTGNRHAAKPEHERASASVVIRATQAEAETWAEAAARSGVSRSAWIRRLANDAALAAEK